MEFNSIKSIHYKDILKLEQNFISLDISVNSTGWVRSRKGVVDYGTYSLESIDELDRRVEFRGFLQELIGYYNYDRIYVEDVIAGTNFKTTKGLIQLNTIVDDMKAFDLIKVDKIIREDNNKWKKYLRQASNYEAEIKKENPKVMIKKSLNLIGFNEEVIQDIYDAMGLAVAMIFKEKVLGEERDDTKPLKKDIRRGYKIKQFDNIEKLLKDAEKDKVKRNRVIEEVDWAEQSRDIMYLFKQKITKDNDDNKIYCITLKSGKLGILALNKKLNTDNELTYLLVTKNK